MSAALLAALALAAPLATVTQVAPPLCRGRQVGGYDPRLDQPASARATAEVQAAYAALCTTGNCGGGQVFRNDTIGMNAVTWVSGLRDGAATRAKIVYSPRFLSSLSERFGDGASFGVLAHEVGHHLTAALAKRGADDTAWEEELRADYLAGCALGRSGRSSAELEAALRALAATASPTHPSFEQRNPMIRRGYEDCRAHQEKFDKLERDKPTFGLGAVVEKGEGCWAYFYRASEDVRTFGPVAAPRRRSPYFATERACELARHEKTRAKARVTEKCACLE